MRAHLVRHVCRRMLGRDALVIAQCRRPRPQSLVSPCPHIAAPHGAPYRIQRRTFLDFFKRSKRSLKIPRFDPGWEDLLSFRENQVNGYRMQPDAEIRKALLKAIHYRLANGLPLMKVHIFVETQALKYLAEREEKLGERLLEIDDLVSAQKAIARSPDAEVEFHLQATEFLHRLLCERFKENEESDASEKKLSGLPPTAEEKWAEMGRYLTCMAKYGGASQGAADLVEFAEKTKDLPPRILQMLWTTALEGLANEKKEQELLDLFDKGQKRGVKYNAKMQHVMVRFYAEKGDREGIQKWLDQPLNSRKAQMRDVTLADIMRFVARSDKDEDKAWGEEVLRIVCDTNPSSQVRHVILQWAVLLKGKSADDMVGMIKVMQSLGHEVTEKTIRYIIQAAVEKGDSYLAERLFSLFDVFGTVPDAQTYLLQVQYRIKAGDLTGAAVAYDLLLGDFSAEVLEESERSTEEDASNGDGEEVRKRHPFDLAPPNPYLWALPVINQYIRALCEAATDEHTQQAIRVAQSVEDRGLPLEPRTLVAMCMAFFARDMNFDVIDALSIYAGQYTVPERNWVCQKFIEYICNPETSTARAWDAYQLMRQFFPELDKASRVRVMQEFFRRKRGDMATHVFGHFRGMEGVVRPTSKEYVQVLEGLGRWPDDDALPLIHNMLKLDPLVQYNTQLYNALMLAWGATDEPYRAGIFWEHIQNSIEGPNYNSLEIVFWVYGRSPWGDENARALWKRLQDMEVVVPEKVWLSYVAGLATQGHPGEVLELVEAGCEGVETLQDDTYGIIYNSFPTSQMRGFFENWALEAIPDVWKRLKKTRRPRTAFEMTTFTALTPRVFKA